MIFVICTLHNQKPVQGHFNNLCWCFALINVFGKKKMKSHPKFIVLNEKIHCIGLCVFILHFLVEIVCNFKPGQRRTNSMFKNIIKVLNL